MKLFMTPLLVGVSLVLGIELCAIGAGNTTSLTDVFGSIRLVGTDAHGAPVGDREASGLVGSAECPEWDWEECANGSFDCREVMCYYPAPLSGGDLVNRTMHTDIECGGNCVTIRGAPQACVDDPT